METFHSPPPLTLIPQVLLEPISQFPQPSHPLNMTAEADATRVEPVGLALVHLICTIIFGVFSSAIVGLRCWVRVSHHVFGTDDGLMLLGWVGARSNLRSVCLLPNARSWITLLPSSSSICSSLVYHAMVCT